MIFTDEEIEVLGLEKYPKDECLTGGCSGLKQKDKNVYERKIWQDGFRSALHLIAKKGAV